MCCTYVLVIYGSFRLLTNSASVFLPHARRLCSYVSVHISSRDLWLSNELGKEVDYGSPSTSGVSLKAKLDLRSTRATNFIAAMNGNGSESKNPFDELDNLANNEFDWSQFDPLAPSTSLPGLSTSDLSSTPPNKTW